MWRVHAQAENLLGLLQQQSSASSDKGGAGDAQHAQQQLDYAAALTFLLSAEWIRQLHSAADQRRHTLLAGAEQGPQSEPAAVEKVVQQLSWALSCLSQAWNAAQPNPAYHTTAAEAAAFLSACAPDCAAHIQLWLRAYSLSSEAMDHTAQADPNAQVQVPMPAALGLPGVITPHVGEKVRA